MFENIKRWVRKEKQQPVEEYKGQRFASKVLIFLAVWITVFTAVVLVGFFWTGGMEPSQLVDSVFTVVGIELGGLLFKRVMDKRIPKNTEDNTQDDEEDLEGEIYD